MSDETKDKVEEIVEKEMVEESTEKEVSKEVVEKEVDSEDVSDDNKGMDMATKALKPANSEQELKMSGVRENTNDELVKAAKGAEEGQKTVDRPSFFISEDQRERITVDIMYNKSNGKILSVSSVGIMGDDDFNSYSYLGHSVEWLEFSVPNYDDIATYRQKSSVYKRDLDRVVVDSVAMRNFLIVWHLKDWSLEDENGKVELSHDEQGILSDDSIKKVYSLSPSILDVVLSVLEKNTILI